MEVKPNEPDGETHLLKPCILRKFHIDVQKVSELIMLCSLGSVMNLLDALTFSCRN